MAKDKSGAIIGAILLGAVGLIGFAIASQKKKCKYCGAGNGLSDSTCKFCGREL